MKKRNILNILNGQSMFNYFRQHHLDKDGLYVPFNEAMCFGDVSVDIFSNQFIEYRCKAHGVTLYQYTSLTLRPLQILFKNQFSNIVLWFDNDMFCQINLLTILAYLNQIKYSEKITFNLVDRENRGFKVIKSFEFGVDGYSDLYIQVLINRYMPQTIHLPVMENGIRLYLEYLKEENEITSYINQHNYMQDNILLTKLLKRFSKYGLGDTQYMLLINSHRNS